MAAARFDPDRHHRHSTRLKNYDYAQGGAYFVTLCAYQRECLFGEVSSGGDMVLNAFGQIVAEEWRRTADNRPYVELDAFVVMPNHVHGILLILPDLPASSKSVQPIRGDIHVAPTGPMPHSLGAIVGGFKSAVARRINLLRETPSAPVWQRNYHDVILRNEAMLNTRRSYILTNLARWAEDEENPLRRR